MKQIIEIVDTKNNSNSFGFDHNKMIKSSPSDGSVLLPDVVPKKRGPGRPPKDPNKQLLYTNSDGIIKAQTGKNENNMQKELEDGYSNTNKLLYSAIAQADTMYLDINTQLDSMRNNRRANIKMQNISDLMNIQVGLINSKISAIRELNNTRNKINDLIMKNKQLNKDTIDQNSDKQVMDAYYALLNAPQYGLPQIGQVLAPTTVNTGITLKGNNLQSDIIGSTMMPANKDFNGNAVINNGYSVDSDFENYKESLSPTQKRMIVGNDPNVKAVVVYDQSTGNKWFDIVNIQNGMSIPGVERPAEFLLDDMKLDFRNGLATNAKANLSYQLVLVGNRAIDEI